MRWHRLQAEGVRHKHGVSTERDVRRVTAAIECCQQKHRTPASDSHCGPCLAQWQSCLSADAVISASLQVQWVCQGAHCFEHLCTPNNAMKLTRKLRVQLCTGAAAASLAAGCVGGAHKHFCAHEDHETRCVLNLRALLLAGAAAVPHAAGCAGEARGRSLPGRRPAAAQQLGAAFGGVGCRLPAGRGHAQPGELCSLALSCLFLS